MPEFQTNKFYQKSKWHFPFSIWYLGSYYKSFGHEVDLWDMNLDRDYPWRNQYDMVGISCITTQVPQVRKLYDSLKRTNEHILIGGIHPTLYPKQVKDYGVVPVIGHTIKDFPNMPPLDYSLLDSEMMKQPKNWVGMITSIGCPYKCTFCVNSIIDEYNKWQAWPARRVCDEIEKAQSIGFKNFFFWDDNFFTSKDRVYEFIECVHRQSLSFEWFAFARANAIDRKLFEECHRIGLRRVSLGAESGSNRVLRKLRKGITTRHTELATRTLEQIGIESSWSYMIGLPGETKEDILLTIAHLKRMGKIMKYPKIVGPMLYCPYPGSKLYQECLDSGWTQPQRFEDWTDEINGSTQDVSKMPWVKEKDMVQVYWFYSFLIPLSYLKIWNLLSLFAKRSNNRKMLLLYPLIVIGATVGKLRHWLRWYRFPIETKWFKKLRMVVGA